MATEATSTEVAAMTMAKVTDTATTTATTTATATATATTAEETLIKACNSGDVTAVCSLLENRVSADACSFGKLPIVAASASGHVEIVELLLEHGAKVDMRENNGLSALFIASENGHTEMVRLLLEYGAEVDLQIPYKMRDLQSSDITKRNDDGLLIDPATVAKTVNQYFKRNLITLSPLLAACTFRHIEIVRILLDCGARVNMYKNFHISPLISASRTGEIEIVKLLLAHGAEVDMASETGIVPLIAAIDSLLVIKLFDIQEDKLSTIKGCVEIVKLLLEHNAEVNIQCKVFDKIIMSPLMYACLTRHIGLIELLIERGADVNILTNEGLSALILACKLGFIEVVKVLLDNGALVNTQNDNIEILKIIADPIKVLRNSIKQHHNFLSPLETACFYGHIEIVRLLLDRGARVNADRNCFTSPLLEASASGHSKIAELLLARGAKINMATKLGEVPLVAAICSRNLKMVIQDLGVVEDRLLSSSIKSGKEGHIETIKLLLKHGAQVNVKENICGCRSPLYMAILMGAHIDAVKLLLDYDADVNVQDHDGWSPLHIASFNGCTETRKQRSYAQNIDSCNLDEFLIEITVNYIELLLDRGAQMNIQDKHGRSPLMIASSIGDAKKVKFLLDYGAEVNLKNNDGSSALAIGVISQNEVVETSILQRVIEEHAETVKVLLDFGAEVDAKDHRGFSAQMIASSNGHIEILQLLIDHGSKIDFKAIDIAREKNHVEVAELLSSKVKAETSSKTITSSEFMLLMQEMKSFEDRMNQRMEQMHNYTVQKMEQMYSQIMLRVSALPNLQGKSITLPHQQHSNDLTHANLLRELMDLACDWNIIGILLEMPDGTLDTIQCDHPNNARQCLLAMLKEWLKIIDPPPSWERMAGAVEQINQKKAHDLREKYCTQ